MYQKHFYTIAGLADGIFHFMLSTFRHNSKWNKSRVGENGIKSHVKVNLVALRSLVTGERSGSEAKFETGN